MGKRADDIAARLAYAAVKEPKIRELCAKYEHETLTQYTKALAIKKCVGCGTKVTTGATKLRRNGWYVIDRQWHCPKCLVG